VPPVDLRLETLAGVLHGDVLVQIHCYKASDMAEMVAVADESGFKIRSFHHALEAYKIRDLLAGARDRDQHPGPTGGGSSSRRSMAFRRNTALVTQQGGRATIHSDSAIGIQRLNQDAAKAMAAGRAAGIAISDDQALRWVTANPAWVLGIDDITRDARARQARRRRGVERLAALGVQPRRAGDRRRRGSPMTAARARLPADFELANSATQRVP